MDVIVRNMFLAVTVMLGIGLVHGYDSKSNFRKIDILETKLLNLETKLDIVVTELKYVKEDLKEEKDKFIKFENRLKDENIDSPFDDKDNDLTRSEPVVNEHREISNDSSFIEQRIYQAFHDEKNLRKQFQNQLQTDFKTEKTQTETKFTALQETLSALIDRKLNTLEDEVRESITVLNTSISSIENITRHVKQNDEAITSLVVESDQHNTTLLEHGALLYSLNDSFVDVQTSVNKLLDNSDRLVCLHGGKHSTEGICECSLPYSGTHCEKECSEIREVYTDCYDIHKHTDKPTGIYTVAPRGSNKTFEVKCDMDIDGGGWTVFQYRHDGSVDFFRKFDAYENGFGSLTGEFWLGLQYIHVMTSSVPSVLRIDVAAADGTQAYQTYDDFNISEGPDYKLNIGATSGTAGDDGTYRSLSYHNGLPFTTYDRDSDGFGGANCAERYHGAWWYGGCGAFVNLNSQYAIPGTHSTIRDGYGGMIYYLFKRKESLKSSKIMFRKT